MKTLSRTTLDGVTCTAVFDDDEIYRYLLTWRWSEAHPLLVAWMLNPSTATHEALDPTVTGMMKRARMWGHGGIQVINLFALRATDPNKMKAHPEPVGPENDIVTIKALSAAHGAGGTIICGWGKHGSHLGRADRALRLAQNIGVGLHVLALNGDGSPRHPLYIPHAQPAIAWSKAA